MENTASLAAGVLLDVEVLLVGEPDEHGAEEGTDELAEEVEDAPDLPVMLPMISWDTVTAGFRWAPLGKAT